MADGVDEKNAGTAMRIGRGDIRFGSDTEFHMLRHFSRVSPSMMASVLSKGHSEMEVEEMLRAPGSRFHPFFADSLEGLLQVLLDHPYRTATGISGNLELCWRLPEADYPSGVGTLSVVPLDSLSVEEMGRCRILRNRGMDLMHLEVEALPNTWECSIVLRPIKSGHLFITAFPGPASMPLPYKGMDALMYAACKEFWDGQVFLVEGM
jgi:hypothetical protein